MAKLEWKSPIEAVHGKLFSGFGAAKRASANNKGEQYNFSVMYGKRKNDPTTAETANRNKFKALAAMYNLRKADTSKKLADQAAFKAQSAISTFKAYQWSKVIAEYNQQQQNAGGGE